MVKQRLSKSAARQRCCDISWRQAVIRFPLRACAHIRGESLSLQFALDTFARIESCYELQAASSAAKIDHRLCSLGVSALEA
jgi:hypothetical protein